MPHSCPTRRASDLCDHRTLEKLQPSAKNKDRRRTFHFRQQGWISILSLEQISCPKRPYPLYFTLDIGKAGEAGSASATPCRQFRNSLQRGLRRAEPGNELKIGDGSDVG